MTKTRGQQTQAAGQTAGQGGNTHNRLNPSVQPSSQHSVSKAPNNETTGAAQTSTPTTPTSTAPAVPSTPIAPVEEVTLCTPAASADILSLIASDINNISTEGKQIASCIVKAMQIMINQKDDKIVQLQGKISSLENKVTQLENQIDEINQYERRDTVIVGGPALPQESSSENSAEVVVRTIKDNLHINITQSDINVAHRLGSRNSQNMKRPIIVKLHSREKKTEIMKACVTIKPNLHINESLTPKRRSLFV